MVAKSNNEKMIWITNDTQRAIHIKGSKAEGAKLSTNRIIAPLTPVQVPESALKIGGVVQLLDKKSLRQLDAAEVAKVEKELAGVIESDDD